MNHPERSFRRVKLPLPRTSLDLIRGKPTIRQGGSRLGGNARRVSQKPTSEEHDWVAKHVFQKPSKSEREKPGPFYERDDKIEWETEVIEDYNGKGGLGIVLQFAEIRFIKEPFLRSRRNYGTDSTVFYTKIDYKTKTAYLILATRGDIFESQIVQVQMDVSPFFQGELYLPQLATTHDPTSMAISQNNGLVTVGYNPLIY